MENQNMANIVQMQQGAEVRQSLQLKLISSSLQISADRTYLKLKNLRGNRRRCNREINRLNHEIAEKERSICQLKLRRNQVEKEKEKIVKNLKSIDSDDEKNMQYDVKVHKDITTEFDLKLRNLIRQHRVCRIKDIDELVKLQSMGMNCSPIIDAGNEQLLHAALSSSVTRSVIFANDPNAVPMG